jgi:perosamine synthetase
MSKFVPVNEPFLGDKEKEYLNECVDTGWISSEGPFVKRFESEMAEFCQRKHGVAVCNGSAALDVAVDILGLGEGDEIILPSFTIVSCASAIVRSGAKPVVVDSDPVTWNMKVEEIERKITPATKAIMAVHIYGFPVDMDPLLALAEKHDLKVIEDAAEMIGQTYKGRPCGSFGDVSTFSFYPNKHITTGEGGMVLCNDDALAEKAAMKRNLCFQAKKRFVHEELGWNMRMTNLQAALGVAQLERIEWAVSRKREIGKLYDSYFSGREDVAVLPPSQTFADNIYWVYGLVLNDSLGLDADQVMPRLGEKGVGTRPFFWPMHEQPVFHQMGLLQGESHPVSERLARKGFYLPSGLGTSDDELKYCAEALVNILDEVS